MCSKPVLPHRTLPRLFNFTLHCSSSISCMNEYLAIDSGGYVCMKQFLRINCSMAGCSSSQDAVRRNRCAAGKV